MIEEKTIRALEEINEAIKIIEKNKEIFWRHLAQIKANISKKEMR